MSCVTKALINIVINRSQPHFIHLTRTNLEAALDQIQFPGVDRLERPQRPFTFFVEGIIGTGKSTLLEAFKVQCCDPFGPDRK
jgi:hypothetical protein